MMQPSLTGFMDFCGLEIIGTALLAALIWIFMGKATFKKNIQFFFAPFFILFVKGVLLFPLQVFSPTTQAVIPFILSSIAAAFIVGGALELFKIKYNQFVVLPAIIGGLLFFGLSFSFFDWFKPIFPSVGSSYVALSLFMAASTIFIHPAVRGYQPMLFWGLSFLFAGLSYTFSIFVTPFIFSLLLWGAAVGFGLAAISSANILTILTLNQLLHTEKNKVKLFVNASPFPILLSRLPDGQVIYTNSEAQRVFGLNAEDLKYFNFSSYFTNPKDRSRLFTALQKDAVVNDFEVNVQNNKTGEASWLSVDARAIEVENEIALYTTFRDITTKKGKEQKLLREALTDALTGLFNRRQFDVMAEKYIQMAQRSKSSFCLMMLDIDHFKNVNDVFGHDAGDVVLMKVAETLKSVTRTSDVLARYGGEEFVLFMPNTNQQEAYFAAERLRGAIEQMDVVLDGEHYPITVSVGLSAENVFDLKQMVKQADMALYIAKESGRNRTAFYEMGSEDI